MRNVKKWDIDWDAPAALIAFSQLEADEIAVAAQIINLIYAQNGEIKNDPDHIKNFVKKMRRDRCERVINSLIHKEVIFLTESGAIMSRRCQQCINNRSTMYQKSKQNGEKGSNKRWEIERNQREKDSPPSRVASESLLSSISSLKTSLPSVTARGSFSIFEVMTEEGEREARRAAPGWDIRHLCGIFDGKVKAGTFTAPNDPDTAFPAWCAKYTKGKAPR